MKTLKNIAKGFSPNSDPDAMLIAKHIVVKHPDRSGNGDEVFKASKSKYIERSKERHGHDAYDDHKVYEKRLDGIKTAVDKLTEGLNEETIGHWSNAGPFIKITKGTDKVTKKPIRHVELHSFGQKQRLITSVDPKWDHNDIKNHLIKTHGHKLKPVQWTIKEEILDEDYTRLQNLKSQISKYESRIKNTPGISPQKKADTVRLQKLKKEHEELFKGQFKEDVEHLDELSKETLKSYVDAATADRYDRFTKEAPKEAYTKSGRKISADWKRVNAKNIKAGQLALSNRSKGIKTAITKLTEDVLEESTFAFHHTPGDPKSEAKLKSLKAIVKAQNKVRQEGEDPVRVLARGRLGKNSPHKDANKERGKRDVAMKHASTHAIYVSPRDKTDWDAPYDFHANRIKSKKVNKVASAIVQVHKALHEEIEDQYITEMTEGMYVDLIEAQYKAFDSAVFPSLEMGTSFKSKLSRAHPDIECYMTHIGQGKHKVDIRSSNNKHKADMIKLAKSHKAIGTSLKEDVIDEAPKFDDHDYSDYAEKTQKTKVKKLRDMMSKAKQSRRNMEEN